MVLRQPSVVAGRMRGTVENLRKIARCAMVGLIGLITISALVWLLAWSLTGESNAERRHSAEVKGRSGAAGVPDAEVPFRRAA